jgi:hypothetical protein
VVCDYRLDHFPLIYRLFLFMRKIKPAIVAGKHRLPMRKTSEFFPSIHRVIEFGYLRNAPLATASARFSSGPHAGLTVKSVQFERSKSGPGVVQRRA